MEGRLRELIVIVEGETLEETMPVVPQDWQWELIALYLASSALGGCNLRQRRRMLGYLSDRYWR